MILRRICAYVHIFQEVEWGSLALRLLPLVNYKVSTLVEISED